MSNPGTARARETRVPARRGQAHASGDADRVVVPATQVNPPTVTRIWAWVGTGPSGHWRTDSSELRDWIAARCDLGITDVCFQLNWKRDATRTRSFSPNSQFSSRDGFARLRAVADGFRERGVDSHGMVFLSPYRDLIRDAGAHLRTIVADVPLRSVMLDCEEWWRGDRAAGVEAVREHFMTGWTWANAGKLGVGVTGLAAAGGEGGIGPLLQAVDYGCPQMYASNGNYGTDLATTGLRLARQDWARYRASLGTKPIIVGQTARPRFPSRDGRAGHPAPETVLNEARMRGMLDVVLQLGGTGDADPPVSELAFWCDDLLLADPADRRRFLRRLCDAARGGGLRREGL